MLRPRWSSLVLPLNARPLVAASLALASSQGACSSSHTQAATLPSFHDVSDAPAPIQKVARAVVRIATANEFATGTFISPSGILLTNNHVLGVGICPIEGCYARMTFMFQRHAPVPMPQTVFVVPLAVDVGLDMAVVQVYADKGTATLSTPEYATIDLRDPISLQGEHVYVVGHPEGHLKKWTEGAVVDAQGFWVKFSAFSLPGDSGSPVLDERGQIVAILHRGPTGLDLVSSEGIEQYSIGTASAQVLAAMGKPLPPAMVSIAAAASDDDVVANQYLYLNARVANATVGGAPKPVLASLGAACDAGLARGNYKSPDDLSVALTPCSVAELWIECRTDVQSDAFAVCPPDPSAWQQRFRTSNERTVSMNGQVALDFVSFAQAALARSKSEGEGIAAVELQSALAAAHTALDLPLAPYLAAFHANGYGGKILLDYVKSYSTVSDYGLWGVEIAAAALWLAQSGQLDRSGVISLLQGLAADGSIDLAAKLYIEDVLYRAQALD